MNLPPDSEVLPGLWLGLSCIGMAVQTVCGSSSVSQGRAGGVRHSVQAPRPRELFARSSDQFLFVTLRRSAMMFERQGFVRVRRLGKNHWVVAKVVR